MEAEWGKICVHDHDTYVDASTDMISIKWLSTAGSPLLFNSTVWWPLKGVSTCIDTWAKAACGRALLADVEVKVRSGTIEHCLTLSWSISSWVTSSALGQKGLYKSPESWTQSWKMVNVPWTPFFETAWHSEWVGSRCHLPHLLLTQTQNQHPSSQLPSLSCYWRKPEVQHMSPLVENKQKRVCEISCSA